MTRESRKKMSSGRAGLAAALARLYPEARISLDFTSPWQCLVATILSAQCTDKRVNQVTPRLFAEVPDARAMDAAPAERIERLILDTGFFRQKTRSLKGAARAILERFGGEVPSRMEDLVDAARRRPQDRQRPARPCLRPAGAGGRHSCAARRASSGADAGDRPREDRAVICRRCSRRAEWTPFSMRLILHGRTVCNARKPRCEVCVLAGDCPRVGVAGRRRHAAGEENFGVGAGEKLCLTSRGDVQ